MEKLFHLKENNTTVRTEIFAGIATFMTMAYIIILNPNLLTGFRANGGDGLWNAVFLATCISSAIGSFLMAAFANKPFAMAPGMGLNTYFAAVAANLMAITGMTYVESFQTLLIVILLEGLLFVVLTVFKVRESLLKAIPASVRSAISPALGLMLINIGFGSNAGVYDSNGNAFYAMTNFFGSLSAGAAKDMMTDAWPMMVLTVVTMLVGLGLVIFLVVKKVRSAVLLGMVGATLLYWGGEYFVLGINPFASLATASFLPPIADLAEYTLFKFNFAGLVKIGWMTVTTLIISFCMIDLFDTLGTLIGTASKANMLDENGEMEGINGAMLSDAVGTMVGAATGTSTVTTFIESAAGVEAGGRTGLTAVVTGIIFLLCTFLSPVAAIIPPAATSVALIYVGISMVGTVKRVNTDNLEELVPLAVMLISMPVAGSIGHSIGLGLISSTAVKIFQGRIKEIHPVTWILCLIFLLKFFVAA